MKKLLLTTAMIMSATFAHAHSHPTNSFQLTCSVTNGFNKIDNYLRLEIDPKGIKMRELNQPVAYIPWHGENQNGSTAEWTSSELIMSNRYKGNSMVISRSDGSFRAIGRGAFGQLIDVAGTCNKIVGKKF